MNAGLLGFPARKARRLAARANRARRYRVMSESLLATGESFNFNPGPVPDTTMMFSDRDLRPFGCTLDIGGSDWLVLVHFSMRCNRNASPAGERLSLYEGTTKLWPTNAPNNAWAAPTTTVHEVSGLAWFVPSPGLRTVEFRYNVSLSTTNGTWSDRMARFTVLA